MRQGYKSIIIGFIFGVTMSQLIVLFKPSPIMRDDFNLSNTLYKRDVNDGIPDESTNRNDEDLPNGNISISDGSRERGINNGSPDESMGTSTTDEGIPNGEISSIADGSRKKNYLLDETALPAATPTDPSQGSNNRCAINFYGLPRAFESLALPSIVKNVIKVNPGCDYFVHYYHMTKEVDARSKGGGMIDPTAVLMLRDAVHEEAKRRGDNNSSSSELPIVEFTHDTDEDFWKKYSDLIEKVRTTKVDGDYLYFPWKAKSYKYPETADNIVKMWHSIQSSFELMESVAVNKGIEYSTVGMFRMDVVYVTPVNVTDAPKVKSTDKLAPATVPNFGNDPVSDRMIYGPKEAVKAWATQRFSQLESHANFMLKKQPGFAMHSELFVSYALLPLIKNITTIRKHPTMCFFRARADETVWISDCSRSAPTAIVDNLLRGNRTFHDVLEDAIGRPCSNEEPRRNSLGFWVLQCRK